MPLAARSLAALGWRDVPPPVRAAFEAARRINAARNALVARALGRVLEGLGRAGVPVIPLKGVALSESLYGDAALRVSADLDILVPRECVARAWTVLGELGYVMADHEERVEASELGLLLESNIEFAFASPEAAGCPVELHWGIAWRWPHSAPALADLWADARPRPFRGAPAHALGPEWELLYLAVHAARHRWESLKWLVDIHEICRRGGLDWEKVRAKADRFGLTDVLEISLQASAALFDTPLPSSSPARALPGWLELFPATPDPLDIWQGALYPARLFARPSERLGYLARVLLVPTLAERRADPAATAPSGALLSAAPAAPGGSVGARRRAWHRTAVPGSLDIVARSGRSSGVAAAPRPPRRGTDSFEAGERLRSSRLAAALGVLRSSSAPSAPPRRSTSASGSPGSS